MSKQEQVIRLISEELRIPKEKISLESNVFDDLNFDSLDSVQIVLELENVFDIDVTDDEIDNIKTIKDIVELVENLS
jgi:acyl carrier protein|tara:strand:- start:38 stop:268 length:231 start_codon:yes stop_codon:yes gene_type:complete